jgi:poly(hydroxyalkanoate) granule-associated protein
VIALDRGAILHRTSHHRTGAHMAKFKKATKKTTARNQAGVQDQAERLSKTLSESAQQIWLAGVGAFGRAQAEGTKLFESLVKEGLNLEQTARKFAGGRADVVRDAVESTVGQARGRATDTWDRLEKVFEDRVQRALVKLGVPGRDDLADLSRRVEALTTELRRQNGARAKSTTVGKPAVRKTKPVVAKAPVAKATRKRVS